MNKETIYEIIIYMIFGCASVISSLGIIFTIIRDKKKEGGKDG